MKKILVGLVSLLLLVIALPLWADSITLTLTAGEYEIVKDSQGYDLIQMEGYGFVGSAGNPVLPSKIYKVVVDPAINWPSLKLTIVNIESETIAGTYNIQPGPAAATSIDGRTVIVWGAGKEIIEGRNMKVYGQNKDYPDKYLEKLPYGQMRKWKFSRIRFTPFRYNPVSGELTLIKKVTFTLSYNQEAPSPLADRVLEDNAMDHLAREKFINYESFKLKYRSTPRSGCGKR